MTRIRQNSVSCPQIRNGVRNAMQGMDMVFHLAALITIPFSYHSPDSYVDTNIKGTLNVLQAARDTGCKRVLITSTSEVYGTAQYVPIDERHPFQGQSPYSATKIGADRIAESFYRSFNTPVTIVRPFNTYGPRQSARAVIPTIIAQLLNGATEISLGSIHPTRDFNYVQDTVAGFIAIAETQATIGEEINIASQQEISIGQLAREIIDQINPTARIVSEDIRVRPEKSEVERLLGGNRNCAFFHEVKMGAVPPSIPPSIDECLQTAMEWYKIFCEAKLHESTYKFSTKQIAEYREKAKKSNLIWTDKIGTLT